jgi:hypothetical protein
MPAALSEGLLAVRCGGLNPRRLLPTLEAWPLGHWPVHKVGLFLRFFLDFHTTGQVFFVWSGQLDLTRFFRSARSDWSS